jgi:mRNA interferase MazF
MPREKKRPALVLSPESRNRYASDVIVVPISSKRRGGPWHVPLKKGEAGIPRASEIRCEQIQTISQDLLAAEPLGKSLDGSQMKRVEYAVMRAIGIPIFDNF